jgi:DnaJ family protein A protein 5
MQANAPSASDLKTLTPSRVDKQNSADAYIEQEWQKVDTSRFHADLDWAVAEGDDLEEWECVVCRKTFRSEAAWNSHERSKKHIKELEKLKREMEQDDVELDLDHHEEVEEVETEFIPDQVDPVPQIIASPESEQLQSNEVVDSSKIPTEKTKGKPGQNQPRVAPDSKITSDEETTIVTGGTDDQTDTTFTQPSKREKRRARQAKKAELQDRKNLVVCNIETSQFI